MAQIRLRRSVRNHGSFKAWLCTHLCNNCYRVLLILQLSLCWFVSIIWKKLEQKEAFNSSLDLYSKAMYSGLPRWLLSPSLPMPLGKTLKGSTAYLPGSPPALLNRWLLQPGGHLQPVQVYRYCPHLLRTLPAAWRRQHVGRGPCGRPACRNSPFLIWSRWGSQGFVSCEPSWHLTVLLGIWSSFQNLLCAVHFATQCCSRFLLLPPKYLQALQMGFIPTMSHSLY